MLVTQAIAKRRGYLPTRSAAARPTEILAAVADAAWALTVPIFIVVGLRYGLFTPTEAGAVIVVYATLVGALRLSRAEARLGGRDPDRGRARDRRGDDHHQRRRRPRLLHDPRTGADPAAEFLTSLTKNPLLMLVIINVFLLILGMFLESLAA